MTEACSEQASWGWGPSKTRSFDGFRRAGRYEHGFKKTLSRSKLYGLIMKQIAQVATLTSGTIQEIGSRVSKEDLQVWGRGGTEELEL